MLFHHTSTHQKGKYKSVNGTENCEIIHASTMWYINMAVAHKWGDSSIVEKQYLEQYKVFSDSGYFFDFERDTTSSLLS